MDIACPPAFVTDYCLVAVDVNEDDYQNKSIPNEGVDEACDGAVCTFTNESWNGALTAGNMLELTYQATFEETEEHPELLSVALNGEETCAEE